LVITIYGFVFVSRHLPCSPAQGATTACLRQSVFMDSVVAVIPPKTWGRYSLAIAGQRRSFAIPFRFQRAFLPSWPIVCPGSRCHGRLFSFRRRSSPARRTTGLAGRP